MVIECQPKRDEVKDAKEKLAWCAISCAAACREVQSGRSHLTATSDEVRRSVGAAAAADIPNFVAVDLCTTSSTGESQHPLSDTS